MRARAQLGRLLAALPLAMGISQAPPAAAAIAPAGEAGPRPAPSAAREDFPLPEALRPAVGFWMRVYLEVTTRSGLLHDARHLGVVYEKIPLGDRRSERARQRRIDARRRHWRDVLRRLARGREPEGPAEEAAVRMLGAALGHPPGPPDLRRASNRIRFQLGQRDKFRQGVIRSGAYESLMRQIFRTHGLPEDLAILPHVESSFNLEAHSKYGAAGVWQFMRSTGRRFLRIDYIVDQRLDPIASTRAAARLLRENHEKLGTWPLAITAYNHGAAGLLRARRKLEADDLVTIIERYHSRVFGFASRNFYAQFLAARRIMGSYESYFGPVEREAPQAVDEVVLPFFLDVGDLDRYLGVAPEVVQHYNLSLRPPVFHSGKRIPRGFVLRLPAGTVSPDPERWLAALPRKHRFTAQHRSRYYTVRLGDTLSAIAARHRTRVGALVALNNLPSRHRIYPGQTLQLPPGSDGRPGPRFAVVGSAKAATRPVPRDRIQPIEGPPPATVEDSPFRRVDGDRVLVDVPETLGHFAEWLELPTQRLRQLNRISRGQKLRFGQHLRLDFSRVDRDAFLQRRMEFHKAIEEDFLGSYRVTGTIAHTLQRGDSLWLLSHRIYRVPAWLIQSFNHDLDLTHLHPGRSIRIPVVEPLAN